MYSIGWKKVSLILFLFSWSAFSQYSFPDSSNDTSLDEASDTGSVFAAGTTNDRPLEGEGNSNSVFLPRGTSAKPLDNVEDKGSSYGLPGYTGKGFSKPTIKQQILGLDKSAVPGQGMGQGGFLEIKNRDIFKKIYNKSSEAFSFSYIMDDYSFDNGNNTFNRTFEDSTGSVKGGSIHFGFDNYLNQGTVRFAWGGNFGVGFNQGRGYFANGQESDTIFNLWTIPLDASVTMELALGKVMKLALTGGPSVMGLMQSRNDKEDTEDSKRRHQFSWGYFGGAKAKISVGNLSSSTAFEMFKSYDVTNFFLNLEARYQNYGNFQEEVLTISGMSFGLGFTFEYL